MSRAILFLDLARTTGWCEGEPNGTPISGTMRIAPDGSDSPAVFGGMLKWLATRLQAFRPRTIVYEAPFDPRHMSKTTFNTARMLLGLPAVVEATAYSCGVYDIREAHVNDIRRFLIGRTPKRQEAKAAVIEHLRGLGFDPADDNESDAIAGWLFACSIADGRAGVRSTGLFAKTE